MTDNVIRFPGETRLDLDPDRVLGDAIGKLKGVVILGYEHDGTEYWAMSYADGEIPLWLVERFKGKLLAISDRKEGE